MAQRPVDEVHGKNEISGGRIGTAVQAGKVDQVVIHERHSPVVGYLVAAVSGAAMAVLVYFVLAASPRLSWPWPVPSSYGTAAVVAGVAAPLAVLGFEVRRRVRRRRSARRLTDDELRRTADKLAHALATQYAREAELGRIHDPLALPVRWVPADPGLGDHVENLADGPHGGGGLLREGEFGAVAEQYARLPRGRLVVLGAAGAGKSVLVLELARELLKRRGASGRVPVVLPLSPWNPREHADPWKWAAGALAEAWPEALADAGLPPRDVARQLIGADLVLPILDGFDELPPALRVDALRSLHALLSGDQHFVMTSRTRAYREAVEQTDLRLPGTAAITLRTLSLADVAGLLRRSSRTRAGGRTKWDPVLDRLADPGAAGTREVRRLRTVLGNPLMVSLARTVYSDTVADPADLLDADRFHSVRALERHLLSAYVDAVYGAESLRGDRTRWPAADARRWLAYLAHRQRQQGRQDIAWWRMGHLAPRWARLVLSLPLAVCVAAAVAAVQLAWEKRLPLWAVAAGGVLAAATAEWLVVDDDKDAPAPQRLQRPRRAVFREVLGGRWARIATALALLLPLGLWGAALVGAVEEGTAVSWTLVSAMLGLFALRSAVRRPADPESRTPRALLRDDRRAALLLGPVALPNSDGVLSGHKAVLGATALVVGSWSLGRGAELMSSWHWLLLLALGMAAATVWSVAASAWARYGVVRCWLAWRGLLPWRLTHFLEHALEHGVLRSSGGYYRFRHLELQNELADSVDAASSASSDLLAPSAAAVPSALSASLAASPAGPRRSVRPAVRATSILLALLALSASVVLFQTTGTATLPPVPVRTLPSACDLLRPQDVRPLVSKPVVLRDVPAAPRENTGHGVFAQSFQAALRQPVDSCTVAEQDPFRPDVVVTAFVGLGRGGDMRTGVEAARQAAMPADSRLYVTGSGQPVADPIAQRLANAYQSAVGYATARVDNAVVGVVVNSQFGSTKQVEQAAEIIARGMLHRAGLVARSDGPGLADVPETEPPKQSRLTAYVRGRTARLTPETWSGGEASGLTVADFRERHVWFVLRTPRFLECGESKAGDDETAWRCTVGNGKDRFTMDMVLSTCRGSCSDKRVQEFFRARPEPWVGDWPQHDRWTNYRTPEPHRAQLGRMFTSGKGDDLDTHLMWLDITAPKGSPELAEKVLNDAFAQTGGRS
ncbi:NACHT domain-containing protein [Streptomyces sp. KM273126]|uniref:NACHT domain-containing protein n=1 Tax=Streptomyces sp. KM273126 TaxID=2545247 RepID=UPI0015EC0AAB|nr:NACHT domain-containing protein [Streptomyces sp. KM273126]MBA2807885.1 NACHT domain-containing protein [Streptomyces sp. KM273126]